MAPKTNQPPVVDPYADIAEGDPYSDIVEPSAPSIDTIIANPKRQGTYKLLAPVGSDIKSGAMVPYGNVRTALQQGFGFDPQSGDDTRYAHDLFTELHGKGQAPSVEDADTYQTVQNYGVIPTPAPGTREWFRRGGIKTAHAVIDSLPAAGAIGGAIAGSPGAITAGLGAAAGAGLGEDLRQTLNQHFFKERLTPKQAAEHLAGQAALGATQELGGRAMAYPLGKMGQYLGYTAEESAKAGIRLLPSEAAGKAPTWMEEFLKGSVLSKGIMEKFREAQNKEALAAANKLMDSISTFKGTPEQLGNMIQDGLEQADKAFRQQQDALYGALDGATEKVVTPPKPKMTVVLKKNGKPLLDAAGKPVMKTVMQPGTTQVMPSMVDLKKFAREQLDEINKPPYFLPKDVSEQARSTFQAILDNPDRVSFKRMRDARSALLSTGRKLEEATGNSKSGLVKKLTQLTDQSLEDAAKNSSIPGLYDRWREANAATAEWHRIFEQKLVDKTVETGDPEFISQFLAGNKVGLQQTRDLMKVLPQKLHDPVRRGLLDDAVSKAIEPRTGAFDEGKFASYVDKLGDERGNIIFGSNWKNIKELVDIIGKINGPVGLAKGGGAALQNVGIMKKLLGAAVSVPAAAALAAGVGTGHLEGGLIGGSIVGLGGLATEATGARAIAWAMVNPGKAAKMLEVARGIARALPYTASIGYNVAKPMAPEQVEKVKGFISNSAPAKVTPVAESVVPPSGSYTHIAVNPNTGHSIGSNDGKMWMDVATGQPIQ